MIDKSLAKISGPLLDRIDIQVEVVPVPFKELSVMTTSESSFVIRNRVISARNIQEERYQNIEGVYCNAQIPSKEIRKVCHISVEGSALLKNAMERLGLSARAYDRILKVSRTIADLDASPDIKTEHLAEAIHYRSLDKGTWGSL